MNIFGLPSNVGVNLYVISAMDNAHEMLEKLKEFKSRISEPGEFDMLDFLDSQTNYNPASYSHKTKNTDTHPFVKKTMEKRNVTKLK